jgi:hypothetical protein
LVGDGLRRGALRQWLPAVGAVGGGADGEGGDANGHCWRLAAGVRSGEKVVSAFYRRRRSVCWGRYFPARRSPARLERLPEAASGDEASRAAAGQLVQARRGACSGGAGPVAAVVAVLGDDRSGRGVMAVKPRPGGWDASAMARRCGGGGAAWRAGEVRASAVERQARGPEERRRGGQRR